ncbi:ATP-binding protein [Geodermatophilus sp. FMUSA9-8]|uniref:ATP-binding protein n=1 Tax=Geodermatophilus sp. FMUSA9-8 TaxID=3120155 RepID=UPI0030099538
MDYPDIFNPLFGAPSDEDLRVAYEQSKVRSVIDSYHGRLDAFAEAIQNAVDAMEKRWASSPVESFHHDTQDGSPRLRIIINADENAIEVIDNGTGVPADKLPELLAPYVSDKRLSPQATRGHKGVGTTFLAYGHPTFEIHTKTSSMPDPVAYRIEGGRTWATEDSASLPPDFTRLDKSHPSLGQYQSGTYVKVSLDESTNLHSVNTVLHNSPSMWAEVLRSNTAVGNTSFHTAGGKAPAWLERSIVTIEHRDGTERVNFTFPLPHLTLGTNARELQWLQNNPSQRREYELIYIERNHADLSKLLASEITELENREDEEAQILLGLYRRYEVSAYASLSYKNTFYEERFRKDINRPNAQRLSLTPGVGGGILVASVGMPMGGLQAHLSETMQPQERRRYFLLLHFNRRYSPDIGRKTLPQELEPLVKWLESTLLRLLRTQNGRLLKDRESGTRPRGSSLLKAEEEVKAVTKEVALLEDMEQELNFDSLILQRAPEWEAEVVAIFCDLLSRSIIRGYKLRALPGSSSRYDALFDYRLSNSDQSTSPEALRISDYQLGSEGLSLTDRWIEFKKDINAFVEDLEAEDASPAKKYFAHVHVLVCWSVSALSSDIYSVTQVNDENRKERSFFGSTHLLTAENNDHVVEVLELRTVLTHAFPLEV